MIGHARSMRSSHIGEVFSYTACLLSHFVWPESCPVCGRACVACCADCLASVVSPLPLFCVKCGGPYGSECCEGTLPCGALSLHEGLSREILLKLKYRNSRSLGIPMGRLIGNTFGAGETDLVIPVPLHRSSKREYNQSALLAEGISSVWNRPADMGALAWKGRSPIRTGLSRVARETLPLDSMEARRRLDGMSVALVDDVYTTGGTMRAAVSAIERAGGTVTLALVWGRRIPSSDDPASWKCD